MPKKEDHSCCYYLFCCCCCEAHRDYSPEIERLSEIETLINQLREANKEALEVNPKTRIKMSEWGMRAQQFSHVISLVRSEKRSRQRDKPQTYGADELENMAVWAVKLKGELAKEKLPWLTDDELSPIYSAKTQLEDAVDNRIKETEMDRDRTMMRDAQRLDMDNKKLDYMSKVSQGQNQSQYQNQNSYNNQNQGYQNQNPNPLMPVQGEVFKME